MDIVTTVEKHTNPVQPKEQDDQVEFVLIGAGNNYFKIGHKLGLSFVKLRREGVTKKRISYRVSQKRLRLKF